MTDEEFSNLLAELKEINERFEKSFAVFSEKTDLLTRDVENAGTKADTAMTNIASWLEEDTK